MHSKSLFFKYAACSIVKVLEKSIGISTAQLLRMVNLPITDTSDMAILYIVFLLYRKGNAMAACGLNLFNIFYQLY